ncbi:MAG: hypothetical protein KDB79_04380 [Acidobacteria bacterium]|nr:hypothetical protein [Acidobacteriota bacterium]
MLILAFAESIQLIPDGSLLIHVVLILVMIWVLNRTFFRPINAILDKRERNKGGHSGEAKEILEDAASKRAEYTKSLQDARSEGYSLIEKVRSEAMSLKQSQIENARTDISKYLETENAGLEKQVGEAKDMIAVEAEKMADQISSNLLKT